MLAWLFWKGDLEILLGDGLAGNLGFERFSCLEVSLLHARDPCHSAESL